MADQRPETCGFCELGVYDWKGKPITCPYCDGTGLATPASTEAGA